MPVCQSNLCALSDSTHLVFSACFIKYVKIKVSKRLEVNKVRGAFNDPSRSLLLPISFGGSSVAMLHILDEHISTQLERNGHAGYKIHIIYIDQASVIPDSEQPKAIDKLRERFSTHKFTSLLLEDVFNYSLIQEGTFYEDKPLALGEAISDNRTRLNQLLSSLPSNTSRVDILNILRSRLLVQFAKQNNCDAILYGDSTTRLAEKTLSETAKGRGNSLPWLTADGFAHDIKIIYPMRDLLRKEITEYASMISEPLTPLISTPKSPVPVSVSSKTTTIDDLMSQYFASVEQNYPSIVANVVRTTSKLIAPQIASSLTCNVCNFPAVRESLSWGGDQRNPASEENEAVSKTTQITCYGCARSIGKY